MRRRTKFSLRIAAFAMAAVMSVPIMDYNDIKKNNKVDAYAEETNDSHASVKNMNDYVTTKDNAEAYEIKGSGKKSDPYLISNEEQFLTFTNQMENGNTYASKYIVQTCDLDMTLLINYRGLYSGRSLFSGEYNGMGHTLNVDFSYIKYKSMIFGTVDGTIKNLGVTGKMDKIQQMSIVGWLKKQGKIINVWSTVDSLNSSTEFAAIAFNSEYGSIIDNCNYKGTVKSGKNYGIAKGYATVTNSNYIMETGSAEVDKTNALGNKIDNFSAATLNQNLSKDLSQYEDIKGEDFAFKGNVGRLSTIYYTYTTESGIEKTEKIEELNPYSREYTVNLTDVDTSKTITVDGVATDLAGVEKVIKKQCDTRR